VGQFTDQAHVVADPAKLAARGLTLAEATRSTLTTAFGGAYVETGERFTLRGVGRAESLAEIGRMVVATRGGAPVLVRDVATVVMGALPRQGAVTKDGEGEVVTGMVLKLKGADSRRVIAAVTARLDEVRGDCRRT
jgi:cobalt-zinc-cadmium resistance protein CzcA